MKTHFNYEERKVITLAALGGMLEFYDFIIYGVFSLYFAQLYFPSGNSLVSIIESYVVFILGYVARPIGGMIFSHIGDIHGRKRILITTVLLMGMSSLGIGILPTYAQIGIAAPLILLLLRLMQGVALGGELPSAYVYISESITQKRGSGFGITMTGVNSGLLLGMFVNYILNYMLTPIEITAYGWRLPFIFGGCLCFISYQIRKTLNETLEFKKVRAKLKFPLAYLFKHHSKQLLAGSFATAIMSGIVVAGIIFMPTYLHTILKVDNTLISHIMPLVMFFNVVTIYFTGRLANRIPPALILRGLLLFCVVLIPLGFWLIAQEYYFSGVALLAILEGVAAMAIPYFVTTLFPAKVRLTGVAMCYNLGFTVFGGMAPIIISGAINHGYGIYQTPLLYLLGIIIVCAVGLYLARQRQGSCLEL